MKKYNSNTAEGKANSKGDFHQECLKHCQLVRYKLNRPLIIDEQLILSHRISVIRFRLLQ